MSWKLLDLYCGGGGAAKGYFRAGFTQIVGVDTVFQKRYPFEFIQSDALEYLRDHHHEFDVVHASPPCQKWSIASNVHRNRGKKYIDYLTPTLAELKKIGIPYVVENVPGAPLDKSITLCGLMFGLKVFRHRHFDCSHFFLFLLIHHTAVAVSERVIILLPVVQVVGKHGGQSCVMSQREVSLSGETQWA